MSLPTETFEDEPLSAAPSPRPPQNAPGATDPRRFRFSPPATPAPADPDAEWDPDADNPDTTDD